MCKAKNPLSLIVQPGGEIEIKAAGEENTLGPLMPEALAPLEEEGCSGSSGASRDAAGGSAEPLAASWDASASGSCSRGLFFEDEVAAGSSSELGIACNDGACSMVGPSAKTSLEGAWDASAKGSCWRGLFFEDEAAPGSSSELGTSCCSMAAKPSLEGGSPTVSGNSLGGEAKRCSKSNPGEPAGDVGDSGVVGE